VGSWTTRARPVTRSPTIPIPRNSEARPSPLREGEEGFGLVEQGILKTVFRLWLSA